MLKYFPLSTTHCLTSFSSVRFASDSQTYQHCIWFWSQHYIKFPKVCPNKEIVQKLLVYLNHCSQPVKGLFSVHVSIIVSVRFRIPVNQSNSAVLLRQVCLFVRQHGTTRLLLDGFSLNLVLEYFSNIYRRNSCFNKI